MILHHYGTYFARELTHTLKNLSTIMLLGTLNKGHFGCPILCQVLSAKLVMKNTVHWQCKHASHLYFFIAGSYGCIFHHSAL